MKRTSSLLIACLIFLLNAVFSSNLMAQFSGKKDKDKEKDNTLKYQMLSNEPDKAANLLLELTPFYFDLWDLNMNMGWGGMAQYNFKNRFSLLVDFRKTYLDRFTTTDGNPSVAHALSDDEQLGYLNYSIIGTYFLKTNLKTVNENVHLKSSSNGNTTTHYYLRIPDCKRLYLYGIRGGFTVLNSTIFSENGDIEYTAHYLPTDTVIPDMTLNQWTSTYMRSSSLVLGFSRQVITDVVINVDGYGKRQCTAITELYADLLFATSIHYSDILVSYRGYGSQQEDQYAPFSVDEKTAKSPFGLRVGWKSSTNDKFSWLGMYGAELGVRPGAPAGMMGNAYLILKFGLNFATRL